MPAVTADTLTLPRLEAATGRARIVKSVTRGPQAYEGEGFPVTRAFAGVPYADLDPFIHMDQMGEVEYAPLEPKGTAWHPHRGFETFTYMIDGTFQHQDNHGGGGIIENGGPKSAVPGCCTRGPEPWPGPPMCSLHATTCAGVGQRFGGHADDLVFFVGHFTQVDVLHRVV